MWDIITDTYNNIWQYRDTRGDDPKYWLLQSIKPIIFFTTLYYLMVIYGPKWMKNRKPMNLKFFVFVYNIAISILNLYIFLELAIYSTRLKYNWLCEPIRTSREPEEMRLLDSAYYYLVSKVFEFLDTFFIIVRKKNNQLSFLHVYHHSSMLVLCWILGRWFPGGNSFLAAMINALIHVVMYSYYGLSVLGPKVTKFLWWKRYITILQLIQFMIGFAIGVNMVIYGCDIPKGLQYLCILYTLSYIILFGQFYVTAYIHTRPVSKAKLSSANQLKSSKNGYKRTITTAAMAN
ncbi:hypothetical protein CHUAL_012123 [Chamberlinius hualienensis]